MKNIIKISIIVFILSFLYSCEKEYSKTVVYRVSENESGFSVQYRDSQGQLVNDNIIVLSKEDVWTYSFNADEGDILFLAAGYKDINSSCKVEIIVGGKNYKQGFSSGDTTKYLIVSGTVPFY